MNTSRILFLFTFSIFLIASVSAMTVSGTWQKEDGSWPSPGEGQILNRDIEYGQSIQFEGEFFSMHPPMKEINIKLYNSGGSLVYTFLSDATIDDYGYYPVYTVNPAVYGASGSFEVRLSGKDDNKDVDSEVLHLTVNPLPQPPANNPPILDSIGNKVVDENSLLQFSISATDADGDTLTYSASNLPTGATFNPTAKQFSWTPNFSQAGSYSVTFTVSDGRGGADSETITITVKDVSQPPDTVPPVITILGDNPATINVFSIYNDAGATAHDNVDGDITGKITKTSNVNTNIIGTYTVTYTVSDNSGNTATKTRTVNVVCQPPVNNPPVITSTPDTQVNEGTSYSYDVEATDADGDTLIYSLTQKPCWLSINSQTGLISGTAPQVSSDTSHTITVKVSDGKDYVTQSYTLTVKDDNHNGHKTSKKGSSQPREVETDELAEEEYFGQFEPKVLYLEAEEEEELSWFQKIIQAITEFFQNLFK